MNTEIKNRSAYHEYFIEDKYDAGMVLVGTEVKSIRDGKVNFVDSFCVFFKGELWVRNMHIAEYRFGTTNNHIAVHDRKLLLTKHELRKLEDKMKEKGHTIVPLRIYFNEKGYA
ncbi:MAG TPA: SsrA-binding protein SmpB, partial [Puia sp.]